MTKAIILSAGQGQRLKPLTNDRPKGMVKVDGRTIIERQIELFHRLGLDDVMIVKGFRAESIPAWGRRHYFNPDFAVTNMVYSLFCAGPELADSPVIVSYGDILYSQSVLSALMVSQAAVSVVVDLEWKSYFGQRFADPYEDAESLVLRADGTIGSIGQSKPAPADVQAQYIGLIKFDETGLAQIRQVQAERANNEQPIGWGRPWNKAYMTDLLQELVQRGHPVTAVPIHRGWCEVDSLRDHELASQIIRGF